MPTNKDALVLASVAKSMDTDREQMGAPFQTLNKP